jgi:hypothetical protein
VNLLWSEKALSIFLDHTYCSKNSWKRSDRLSPVVSTTLGMSAPGTCRRGPLPTISSSANGASLNAAGVPMIELAARGRDESRPCRLDREEGAYEGACEGASLRGPAGVGA